MGLYLIHPQNEDYLQGKKSAPYGMGRGAAGFLFSCLTNFLILVVLSLPVLLILTDEQTSLILGPTVKAEGLIVDRKVVKGDESTFYYIIYEYVVNDQRFRRQESVNSSLYDRAVPGVRLRIEYLSTNPSVARIEGSTREASFVVLAVLLIILLMILLVVVVLVSQARESRRQRERLKKGKPIKGQVLQVRTEEREDSDGDRYTATILRVRFQTPQGRIIEGEESHSYKRLIENPPSTENTVAIFYVDDKDWELL